MKISLQEKVRYADISQGSQVRTPVIWGYLQEAAIYHASLCGDSPKELKERGFAWVLHKMAVQIIGTAHYEDKIEVVTWSRGARGFRAYRDFAVLAQGSLLAKATSIWAYISTNDARIQRIPSDLMERYSSEPEEATDIDLEEWRPATIINEDYAIDITIRYQDFDTNRHMNNVAYISLLETGIEQCIKQKPDFREIRLQYDRSVEANISMLRVGLQRIEKDRLTLKVFDKENVFCRGECRLMLDALGGE